MGIDMKQLIKEAKYASLNAYAPYSGFQVGAALVCEDGKIYTGCNVESVSYGATICAERTAAVKAVSEGQTKFIALAIYTDTEEYVYPCGICRQFLIEFAAEDMKIIVSNKKDEYAICELGELLPHAFDSF